MSEIPMDRTKWLTIEELAEYLKMGRTKLYRMAQDGEIPASKVGNHGASTGTKSTSG